MTTAGASSGRPSHGKTEVGETQLAASVVLALHRLVKQSTLYTTENEAQRRQLDQTQRAVLEYGRRTGRNAKLYFTDRAVFVGGRLLRAGRAIYDAALELGRLLGRFGIDEVTIGHDVTLDELRLFQRHVAEAIRNPASEPPMSQRYQRIRLRRGSPPQAARKETTSPEEQIVRGYATAIVVMRRFLERLQAGEHLLPARVRRLAEQLADLGAVESPVYLASIALYNARHEHAGRAVNAALLALGMARQVTEERPLLSRIALAALLFDVGIPRVAGAGPLGDERVGLALPRLGEEQLAELPHATVSVVTALGGMSKATKAVAVLVYEAMSLYHRGHAPPLYDGARAPTIEARIVAMARHFTALVADPDQEMSADQAIATIRRLARDDADETAARLLICALGIFPTGTLVELDGGTIAQVVRVSPDIRRFAFPVVRPIVDATGGTRGGLVDLATDRQRRIVRVVSLGDPPPASEASTSHHDELEALEDAADEPTPPRAASYAPPADEDDDDVPSMVLQAIVDGRRGEAEDENTAVFATKKPALGALFFGAAAPAPAPTPGQAPADPPTANPSKSRPAPSVQEPARPTPGRGMVSKGTPLRGIARGTSALGIRKGKSLREAHDDTPAEGMEPQIAAASATAPGSRSMPVAPERRANAKAASDTIDSLRASLKDVPPTAQGHLGKTPLVHLLVYTFDRSLGGTLVLTTEEPAIHLVFFDQGVPAKARTAGVVAPLDQVLIEMGRLEAPALQASLEAISKTGELHGRHLVKAGLLDAAGVKAALSWQLIRKVGFMLKLPPTTRYAFYAGRNLLDDYGGPELTPVEPLTLIMTGARILGGTELVARTLERLGPAPLRLRRDAAIDKLALKEAERKVVELLRVRALTLRELLAREIAHPQIVRQTIYALLITRYLKLDDQGRPPLGAGRAAIPLPLPGAPGASFPGGAASAASPGAVGAEGPSRPAPRRTSSPRHAEAASGEKAPLPRRGTSSSEPLPRRGTSSSEPLPRRGTSSSEPLPRRGTSSSEPLPRRGTSSARAAERISSPGRESATPASRISSPRPPTSQAPRRLSSPRPPRSRPSGPGAIESNRPSPNASPLPLSSPRPPRSSSPGRLSSPGTPPSRPSGAPSPEAAPRLDRELVATTVASIGQQTYFEILGIEVDALSSEVQSSYFELARLWHPDRIPPELSDMKPQVSRVFARINEAFQTLSHPERRREYTDLVRSGGGTTRDREILERAVDSAMLFQKGEIYFKKGDYVQAELHVRQAVEADPEQPEYTALLAWVQAHRLGATPAHPHSYSRQIQMLDAVIEKDPEYERARFYRGTLLKRSGKLEAAHADFRVVVKLNPRNIDAAREVRLFQMRKRDGPDGLLGRLFKKK